ncbi:lipopolysaccharide biosynthesis protein [Ruminococcus flavefaciens]|uniref:lipopolysaccharide biosynthesis protein n=1 Tax=Ruminococcus flavefaciens TaxID=1265 RepID=UPI00048DBF49|nr:oligosaccharide flippase family protein [Ruminococcus flavefaciens]
MKIQRAKNTKRSIFYGSINRVVVLLLPFINRTVMIKVLGADYLGLNSLCTSILQVLSLSELGVGSALVYSMYKPLADDDNEEICALLNLYRKIYRIIAIVMTGLGICVLPFLTLLIHGDIPNGVNIYIAFFLYLINSVLSYVLFAYKASIPTVMQRNDIISNINTLTQGAMQIAQIIVLLIFKNYYLSLIIMPCSTILNNLILSWIVSNKYSQFKPKGEVSQEKKKEIKVKISGLIINKVCQVTRNSLDSICISSFLGLTITAMYNNYYYVITTLIGFCVVILSSMQSGIGNSVVTESVEKNYEDMEKLNFVYMWLNGFCTVCLVCLYQPFMKLWQGENMMFPLQVAILFSVYYYALKMGDIRGLYSDGLGLWWENRYRALAETVANLVLNIVLGYFFGVYGIICATLISLLIINFGFGSKIVFVHYFKNEKIGKYFFYHFFYATVTALACILTYLICIQFHFSSMFLELLIRCVICIIIPNIVFFLIYHKTKMFKVAVPWVLGKFWRKTS